MSAGKFDWGEFGYSIANAFTSYINTKVVKTIENTIQNNTAAHGISGYVANGFSDANWVATARKIELANGGAKVYALGTKVGLMNVLPASNNTQFRFDENSNIVKTGLLPAYKGIPMVELGQALIPNTINGTPSVLVNDNIIYMLPTAMNTAPVHVVFEGNSLTVEKNPLEQADHTHVMTINAMMGIGVVVGAKMGAIILQ